MQHTKIINLMLFVIMYFLFFYITIFTPFHSDDYSYYLKGLSFETHISHYLNWSGRFVADYLSSLLLATKSQLLTAMIRSLVCSLLVVLIFKIGFNRDSINKKASFIFPIIIFALFFDNIPSIGQGILWIVGFANYSFTTFFGVLFIFLFQRLNRNSNALTYLFCGIIAFLAGLSTEFMALFLSMYFTYYFFTTKELSRTKLLIVGVPLALGVMILIFAPGNYVRLYSGNYDEYVSKSFLEKILYFFQHGLSYSLNKLKFLILLGAILQFITYKSSKKLDKRSLTFFCLAIINVLLIFLSPYASKRALIIPFTILMISISCSLSTIEKTYFTSNNEHKKANIILKLSLTISLLLFIFHYLFVAIPVTRTYYQDQFRNYLVMQNHKNVEIPQYYWISEYRSGDKIDWYFNPGTMASFFGVKSKISLKKSNFDYGSIVDGVHVNLLSKNKKIATLHIKKHLILMKTTFIIGLEENTPIKNQNKIDLIDKKGQRETLYISKDNMIADKQNKIIYLGITKKINLGNLKSVIFNDEIEYFLNMNIKL